MESQALKTRYCKLAVLSALLTELFGTNFVVEVYNSSGIGCKAELSIEQDQGEFFLLTIPRRLTEVRSAPGSMSKNAYR